MPHEVIESMGTIFDSLVTKENDHTNLLRNVMELYPRVAASIMSYLLGRDVSVAEADAFDLRTQYSFLGPDGRAIPDLIVEGPSLRCLIEAKIDPGLGLTEQQQNGYRACFEAPGERHLCFLVPDNWKHSKNVTPIRESLSSAGIRVHECNWRGILQTLDKTPEALSTPILVEAIRFWKWRFEVLAMSPKEMEFLNAWSGEQFSAFRKLEKSIHQTKELFDRCGSGYETEAETSFSESYGFYIKRSGRYLLWVGIWAESPIPLSYGFHPTKAGWQRPKPIPASPHSTRDGYHLWALGPQTWGDPEKIFSIVKSFLASQKYD